MFEGLTYQFYILLLLFDFEFNFQMWRMGYREKTVRPMTKPILNKLIQFRTNTNDKNFIDYNGGNFFKIIIKL